MMDEFHSERRRMVLATAPCLAVAVAWAAERGRNAAGDRAAKTTTGGHVKVDNINGWPTGARDGVPFPLLRLLALEEVAAIDFGKSSTSNDSARLPPLRRWDPPLLPFFSKTPPILPPDRPPSPPFLHLPALCRSRRKRRSARSGRWPSSRSKTSRSPTGSVCGPAARSVTTSSGDTGAGPSWASNDVTLITDFTFSHKGTGRVTARDRLGVLVCPRPRPLPRRLLPLLLLLLRRCSPCRGRHGSSAPSRVSSWCRLLAWPVAACRCKTNRGLWPPRRRAPCPRPRASGATTP